MDYIIIVAGGKGLRMGAEIPKQFLPIGGKPVLMRTIERFLAYDKDINIIVVLPRGQQEYWRRLCVEHSFGVKHAIADGGATRFESSRNGIALVPDNATGVVGIHDGVRPFVSVEVIRSCFDAARKELAAIPVIPVTDTLRYVGDKEAAHNILRSDYRIVQTPQVFDIGLAKKAFRQPYSEAFTDDASVIEHLGGTVAMVSGNRENIKLTTPFDLKTAENIINEE